MQGVRDTEVGTSEWKSNMLKQKTGEAPRLARVPSIFSLDARGWLALCGYSLSDTRLPYLVSLVCPAGLSRRGRLPSPNWLETESASPLSRWKLASLRRYARLGETGGAVGVTRTTLDSTRGSVEGVIRTTLNSAGHPLECERTTLDSTRGSVEGVTRRPQ
eukprot:5442385-Pyramimonas_sp.AAC.1